jgi:hypothetical protein
MRGTKLVPILDLKFNLEYGSQTSMPESRFKGRWTKTNVLALKVCAAILLTQCVGSRAVLGQTGIPTIRSSALHAQIVSLHDCGRIEIAGHYRLSSNVTSDGTCFFIESNGVSVDLGRHTVTYGVKSASRPTPGILLGGPELAATLDSTGQSNLHADFELFDGSIVESHQAAPRSHAIWIGRTATSTAGPANIHNLIISVQTTASVAIFSNYGAAGVRVHHNVIYFNTVNIQMPWQTPLAARSLFQGVAILIGGDGVAHPGRQDLIYENKIIGGPQGGIRDDSPYARVYSNDISQNATYSNDFCIDAPADFQEVAFNHCHPSSGRGIHSHGSHVRIHDNVIDVIELKQNVEYKGCQLGGTYGIQYESDELVPTETSITNNYIVARAGDCPAHGLRFTDLSANSSATVKGNHIRTLNSRGEGRDSALSFSNVTTAGLVISGNDFRSSFAFGHTDWDSQNATVIATNHWRGKPQFTWDAEDGDYPAEITIQDAIPAKLNCGQESRMHLHISGNIFHCPR